MTSAIKYKNELGAGFYTARDISHLLGLPVAKVNRYLKQYWDERLGNQLFNDTYSWQTIKKTKAVNFYVLMELHAFFALQDLGVPTRKILEAREQISKDTGLQYPFASAKLMTDGKKILYRFRDCIINADGTRQTNFEEIIRDFLKKVEFDSEDMVERFFPSGKASKVVIDPHHQFGQPVILGTNLNTEVIFNMYESKESVETICTLFDITQREVLDAIHFHSKAA